MTKPLITVLLPTRKRTAMVKRSITTILELATDPSRLHIAIAYDSDDAESETYFGSNEWKLLVENTGATQVVYKIERQGWMELHEYYNPFVTHLQIYFRVILLLFSFFKCFVKF